MSKILLTLLMSFGLAAAVHAQVTGGVTVSTDPARAAAVERHAQELRAQQAGPSGHAALTGSMHAAEHHAPHHSAKASMRHAAHRAAGRSGHPAAHRAAHQAAHPTAHPAAHHASRHSRTQPKHL